MELYTAQFIWIQSEGVNIKPKGQGYTTYDRFRVEQILYESGVIVALSIRNETMKKRVFIYDVRKKESK